MSGLLLRSHMNAGQDGFRSMSSSHDIGLDVTDVLPRNHAIGKLARQTETSDAARPIYRGSDHCVLREHEAGVKTAELCRKHGISDATFYNW